MSTARKMKQPAQLGSGSPSSEAGRSAAFAYVVGEIRRTLKSDGVFLDWELNAISAAVIATLRSKGQLDKETLAKELHSQQFPKDFAYRLATALSFRF